MATTSTGVTYLSADKIAISLIENPPTGRSLNTSEKQKIATYMARPASERASIEQEVLGRIVTGGTPTTTPTTPTTPSATPTAPISPTTTPTTTYNPPEAIKKAVEALTKGYMTADLSEADIAEYKDYLAYIQTPEGAGLPVPKDPAEYIINRDKWAAGDIPGDVEPIEGFTNDQIREYRAWLSWYSAYGELGDKKPVSIEDFYNNYDEFQNLMSVFQERVGVSEQERAEAEAYTAEQRARAEYRAKEEFREAPMYQETFAAWIGQQGDVSQALKGYIEKEYPSLRTEFQAGLPRLTGFPTREEARAEATRREAGFKAWLPQQRPEIYQEYMGQRPAERGERLWMQAPPLRAVNW